MVAMWITAEDMLKQTEFRRAQNNGGAVTLNLSDDALDRLDRLAIARGLGQSPVARDIVLATLYPEKAHG
jgi:hypothetical protein